MYRMNPKSQQKAILWSVKYSTVSLRQTVSTVGTTYGTSGEHPDAVSSRREQTALFFVEPSWSPACGSKKRERAFPRKGTPWQRGVPPTCRWRTLRRLDFPDSLTVPTPAPKSSAQKTNECEKWKKRLEYAIPQFYCASVYVLCSIVYAHIN
ncbi:hypothetical protein EVAR_77291_1 [Eumeta japonica]|uniref:Uncharacterized protein n=1 Tax=Eumeta variegata TaxID=151549 RepID=A0A4C1UMF2_EUMVA|nr:hypothetical protein EVAR_77291_1 [Eumeta japonica]